MCEGSPPTQPVSRATLYVCYVCAWLIMMPSAAYILYSVYWQPLLLAIYDTMIMLQLVYMLYSVRGVPVS